MVDKVIIIFPHPINQNCDCQVLLYIYIYKSLKLIRIGSGHYRAHTSTQRIIDRHWLAPPHSFTCWNISNVFDSSHWTGLPLPRFCPRSIHQFPWPQTNIKPWSSPRLGRSKVRRFLKDGRRKGPGNAALAASQCWSGAGRIRTCLVLSIFVYLKIRKTSRLVFNVHMNRIASNDLDQVIHQTEGVWALAPHEFARLIHHIHPLPHRTHLPLPQSHPAWVGGLGFATSVNMFKIVCILNWLVAA